MPIYEYRCNQCDHEFEKLVFRSSETIACPRCKSDRVGRLMSAFAFSVAGKSAGTSSSTGGSSCGSCSSHHCSTCGK